jgi:hypothetical protein
MQNGNELQLATLLIPLLALIIISSVDSVQEDDGPFYRSVIAGLGFAAIGPMAVVIIEGVLSTRFEITSSSVFSYSLYSIGIVILLIG